MRAFRTAGITIVLSLVLTPGALFGQKKFEGAVTYNMTMSQGMSMDLVQYVKDDRMRVEMTMGAMGSMITLVDGSTGKTTMLIPSQKAYMDPNAMASAMGAQQPDRDDKPAPKVTIEKTGETETVAGYSCEHVTVTVDANRIDYCITSELGYFFGAGAGSNSRAGRGGAASNRNAGLDKDTEAMIRREFPKGFFPLKMSTAQQGMQMTLTALKIEEKSLSDDLFEVPSDYTPMMGGRGRGGN